MGHIVVCVNHSANCWQYYDATAAIYCVLTAAGPFFFCVIRSFADHRSAGEV